MKKNTMTVKHFLEKMDTGKKENVQNTYPKFNQDKQHYSHKKTQQNASRPVNQDGSFPYVFYERKPNKKSIEAFHNRLLEDHYDIAFEITWEALTPAALNPVTDPKEKPNFPENDNNEYQGYNKRWLTIDNRLAISPFTVKSAIANGFANILGGCYRVIPKERIVRDAEIENPMSYPYGGAYKRYRVAMDKSRPGIVKSLEYVKEKDVIHIVIEKVEEYFCDHNPTVKLEIGKEYIASWVYGKKIKNKNGTKEIEEDKNKKIIVTLFENNRKLEEGEIIVIYYDTYRFGMNLSLKPGDLKKSHQKRFYKKINETVEGEISSLYFKPLKQLKEKVYMGRFKRLDKQSDPRQYFEGENWYDNLIDNNERIDVGSFIYYEEFNKRVTNIGKNFLFKALFLHEDAVPEESSECIDLTGNLCPRCRMFGMTDKTDKSLESIGFKGRFKSSALINDKELMENITLEHIRINDKELREEIPLKTWCDKETCDKETCDKETCDKETKKVIASQELLPLSGPPKPNKRDIDGYFNKDQGIIKGAKYYLHGKLDSARNIWNVDADSEYTHRLRNYAQVCRKNLCFSGTVGAENCSVDEISAFLILLHSDYSHHGFKLGLGKAFGMGTFKSSINKVWIRKKDDYGSWQAVKNENSTQDQFLNELKKYISQIDSTYKKHKDIIEKTANMINNMEVMERRTLKYPQPRDYWKSAANMKK